MDWEFNILYFLQSIHTPIMDKIMVAITTLGDVGIIWIVIAMLMLASKKYRKCGVTMMLGLLIMIILGNGILKNIVARERPCWIDTSIQLLITNPHDYSFPSGHTYSSIVSASIICLWNKRAGIPALTLAMLIAFSRMYLFVHFPTDVIASLVLGLVTALLSADLVSRYYDKIIKRVKEKRL